MWIFYIQAKEDEVGGLKQDSVRLTRQREAIQRKLRTIEEQKVETEHQKETLKNQINALEKGEILISLLMNIIICLVFSSMDEGTFAVIQWQATSIYDTHIELALYFYLSLIHI